MEALNAEISEWLNRLEAVREQVDARFGGMHFDRLNWKPDAATWSVAQVLDHVLTSNETYFDLFDEIASGKRKRRFWERISPFSGVLGRKMVKDLGAEVRKKYTSPPAFRPKQSQITADIVDRFDDHIKALKEKYEALRGQDGRQIITSPAAGFITYSLHNALAIIAGHAERHLYQAIRLAEHTNFPPQTQENDPSN